MKRVRTPNEATPVVVAMDLEEQLARAFARQIRRREADALERQLADLALRADQIRAEAEAELAR